MTVAARADIAAIAATGRAEQVSPPAAQRVAWIDAARGLAIILVAFAHAAGGLIDAAGPGTLAALRYLFLAIYTFHMPLFFFLSGLFVEQRWEKGTAAFLKQLAVTIVYAYFLWSIVQYSLIYALGSIVNHPVDVYWETILALPWRTVSQFWFLHALFLIHLLGVVAWRIGGRRAVIAAAIIVKLVAIFVPSLPILSMAAGNAPYYALAVFLGRERVSQLLDRASASLRLVICGGAAVVLVLLCANANAIQPYLTVETASSSGIAKLAWIPAMLPATLLAASAALLISVQLAQRQGLATRALEYLGTMTMPIFVLHIIFIAGVRIVAVKLFGVGGVALLPLLVVVGIGGPLLIRQVTDRLRLTKILALR